MNKRVLTANEKLYVAADALQYSFNLQLVLEMDKKIDLSSLNQAIARASEAHPEVFLRARLTLGQARWYELKNQVTEVGRLEIEWDGHDLQALAALHGHRFTPQESNIAITYISGTRHFIIFRVFHGLMDAMGLYHWVNTIFCAWNEQTLPKATSLLADYDFLKSKRLNQYRTAFAFDCIAPMERAEHKNTHFIWRKLTLPGKIHGLTAKLCAHLLKASVDLGAQKARFMIPVDLRKHCSEATTSANFSNPIFIEAERGASWQDIYSEMVRQLAQHQELALGKMDMVLQYLPLPWIKSLCRALINYQNKKNKYMVSALVSKTEIKLTQFNTNHCKAIDGFFLPIDVPLSPLTLVVTEHECHTIICFSVPNSMQESSITLENEFKKLTSTTPRCDVFWPIFNQTGAPYLQHDSISARIWKHIAEYPQRPAIIKANQRTLSYQQLAQRIQAIARHFAGLGVTTGSLVALFLPNNEEAICAMLACWYLGAAYLPIDVKAPLPWVLKILDDAKPTLLVSANTSLFEAQYVGLLTSLSAPFLNAPIPSAPANSLTQLAYVIYTSGSTGTPKGVMINHQQLHNYLSWALTAYAATDKPYHSALFTSIAFDLTITPLYLPLLSAGSLTLSAEPLTSVRLKELLMHHSINFLKLTPSHLRMVHNLPFQTMKELTLVVGGEDLPCALASSLSKKLPKVRLFNEYGPTETTVGCMYYHYNPTQDKEGSVPIGKPIANTRIYCLDQQGQPAAIGQEGEIYIAGNNVGQGYLYQPKISEKNFLPDPFYPGERMYRSGDLATHREDGVLIYLGRADQQVKIRGHRIELSTIENSLLSHCGIMQAVVVVNKEQHMVLAYLVTTTRLNIELIRQYLATQLPHYMIPQQFIFLTELPMTINGKVDLQKLPPPKKIIAPIIEEPPKNRLTQIRQLFAKVLTLPLAQIAPEATFSELGGDSLQMACLINEILTQIVPVQSHPAFRQILEQLLACPTPDYVAQQIEKLPPAPQ